MTQNKVSTSNKENVSLTPYSIGMRINGEVNNITDLGIFVTLDKDSSGLIHRNDFADWLNERQQFSVGQELRVVIVTIQNNKIGLSLSRVNDVTIVDQGNKFYGTKSNAFEEVLLDVLAKTGNELTKLDKKDNGR